STIEFADAALKFYGSKGGGDIQPQVAGVIDPDMVLRAVETDVETGACVARLRNTSRTLQLAYECGNPASCSPEQTLQVNGQPVSPNNGNAVLGYSTATVNFDADGYAALPFIYSDVGQLRLHARLDLPEEDEHPAIVLNGRSNDFVVKP